MKKLYLLYLLSLFSLVGCKKDSFEYKSIIGTWEIRASISGLTGSKTTHAPGNGNTVKFGATSYKTQSSAGTYKIVRDSSLITNKLGNRIIYDGQEDDLKTFVNISQDTLSIAIDAYDGPAEIYVKI